MATLLVVDNPQRWPLDVPGVDVVAARKYLTDESFGRARGTRVFNLCRSYSYQSLGYYVSLLAEARGHWPQPDVLTIQDLKSASLIRTIAEDVDALIQRTLRSVRGEQFTLSIYFGRTLAKRDRTLGLRLFGLFPAPLLRAQFQKKRDRWQLQSLRPIAASEIPDRHRSEVIAAAQQYFARGRRSATRRASTRFDLAILIDPNERQPPSNDAALNRFVRAAQRQNVDAELITRDDYGRLAEFDALFIRATTFVNHYTYRFSRRAEADGLAVIDDPTSILRCTNKVYLAESLARRGIPTPRTVVAHRDNVADVLDQIGLPCVLKQPDSAFSAGVKKAEDRQQLDQMLVDLLEDSELVIAQQFMPTEFDWRIGLLDGKPLYACRYHMVRRHWQIVHHVDGGDIREGDTDTLCIEEAPPHVVRTAVRAGKIIGDGLYGVDLKLIGRRAYVIEVNDNPSIDAGYEDAVLRNELYDRIIGSLAERVERLRNGGD